MPLDMSAARPSAGARAESLAPRTRPRPGRPGAIVRESTKRGERPVDPMLLVFEERVRTFGLLAQWLRRGLASLR